MTTITDLGVFDYYPLPEQLPSLRAVGWLGESQPYNTGEVSRDFYDKLASLIWQPLALPASAGLHQCELCQFDGPNSSGEMFVPGCGLLYVAPVLIKHYVAAHRYLPPEEFIAAVLECPESRSVAYRKAFLNNGGRELMKAITALG